MPGQLVTDINQINQSRLKVPWTLLLCGLEAQPGMDSHFTADEENRQGISEWDKTTQSLNLTKDVADHAPTGLTLWEQ